MKIKIFQGDDLEDLQNEINEFIQDKEIIGIFQSQSSYKYFDREDNCLHVTLVTITIYYK